MAIFIGTFLDWIFLWRESSFASNSLIYASFLDSDSIMYYYCFYRKLSTLLWLLDYAVIFASLDLIGDVGD